MLQMCKLSVLSGFVFEIVPGPPVLGKAALRFYPDDGFDDQSGYQDQSDDHPAEDDVARERIIVRLSIDTAIPDEADQVPCEQAAEQEQRLIINAGIKEVITQSGIMKVTDWEG